VETSKKTTPPCGKSTCLLKLSWRALSTAPRVSRCAPPGWPIPCPKPARGRSWPRSARKSPPPPSSSFLARSLWPLRPPVASHQRLVFPLVADVRRDPFRALSRLPPCPGSISALHHRPSPVWYWGGTGAWRLAWLNPAPPRHWGQNRLAGCLFRSLSAPCTRVRGHQGCVRGALTKGGTKLAQNAPGAALPPDLPGATLSPHKTAYFIHPCGCEEIERVRVGMRGGQGTVIQRLGDVWV